MDLVRSYLIGFQQEQFPIESAQPPMQELYGDPSTLPMYGANLPLTQPSGGSYITQPLQYPEMRGVPMQVPGLPPVNYNSLPHQDNYSVMPVSDVANVGFTLSPVPAVMQQNKRVVEPTHSDVTPYVCPVATCRKEFASKQELRKHQVEHVENGKLYRCDYPNCNASFITASGLYKHRRMHSTSQRLFRCEYEGCSKVFATKHGLCLHQQNKHTNHKPYTCKQ